MHGFEKKPEEVHENYITEKHEINDILKFAYLSSGFLKKSWRYFQVFYLRTNFTTWFP